MRCKLIARSAMTAAITVSIVFSLNGCATLVGGVACGSVSALTGSYDFASKCFQDAVSEGVKQDLGYRTSLDKRRTARGLKAEGLAVPPSHHSSHAKLIINEMNSIEIVEND